MYKLALPLGLIITLVDQATKYWAEQALSDGQRLSVIGDFLSFTLVYNPGAAFSFGTGNTWLFTIFSIVVIAVITYVLKECKSKPWAITLGVIVGGAMGNFIDRIFRDPSFGQGHVVDFINYNGWFVGNVADVALVLGVAALIVIELKGVPFGGKQARAEDEEAEPVHE